MGLNKGGGYILKVTGVVDVRFKGSGSVFYQLHRLIMSVPFIGSGGRKCCVVVGRDS